jgi:hypothetical protein
MMMTGLSVSVSTEWGGVLDNKTHKWVDKDVCVVLRAGNDDETSGGVWDIVRFVCDALEMGGSDPLVINVSVSSGYDGQLAGLFAEHVLASWTAFRGRRGDAKRVIMTRPVELVVAVQDKNKRGLIVSGIGELLMLDPIVKSEVKVTIALPVEYVDSC